MSSTERQGVRLDVRLAALGLTALAMYGLLCLGDFALLRWTNEQRLRSNAPARQIEELRQKTEDQPQIRSARAGHFQPMLFPALFESGAFREMALRHGIAPLAPQPLSPIYYCNEGTGLITYRTDRFGFRNPDAVWDAPAIDIVVIGDSYAQGACVSDDQTISAQLSGPGHRTVINLATAGNGPLVYAALARTFLPHVAPRVAIIFFYANDNVNEEDSIYRSYLTHQPDYIGQDHGRRQPGKAFKALEQLYAQSLVEAERQRLKASAPTPASWHDRVWPYLTLSHMRGLLSTTLDALMNPGLPWSTKIAVDSLAQACRPPNCTPLFVYIPNSPFWRPDTRAEPYRLALAQYVQSTTRQSLVDTSQAIAAMGLEAYSTKGGHLSPQGYALLARTVNAHLPR